MKDNVLLDIGVFGGGGRLLHAVLLVAEALEQGPDFALEESNAWEDRPLKN